MNLHYETAKFQLLFHDVISINFIIVEFHKTLK